MPSGAVTKEECVDLSTFRESMREHGIDEANIRRIVVHGHDTEADYGELLYPICGPGERIATLTLFRKRDEEVKVKSKVDGSKQELRLWLIGRAGIGTLVKYIAERLAMKEAPLRTVSLLIRNANLSEYTPVAEACLKQPSLSRVDFATGHWRDDHGGQYDHFYETLARCVGDAETHIKEIYVDRCSVGPRGLLAMAEALRHTNTEEIWLGTSLDAKHVLHMLVGASPQSLSVKNLYVNGWHVRCRNRQIGDSERV